ncbi:class I SAM-dependent methyltransferase [Microbacterium sp. P02]|uniref:class I SAM-dependent methyltransferase n=1 Tax=unclassified Microbacterium TaxID=2609290 RepID=UPI00366ABB9A
MSSPVASAYADRAGEYVAKLGAISSAHPSDLQLITSWASRIDGPILDAGCGPGHWTAHLVQQGHDVRGVDQVPEFIDHARHTYPGVPFTVGSFDRLPDADGSVDGILAWYSLIHHDPSAVRATLEEFGRMLRPGGALLIGFFIGPLVEPFDHAVITAYRWPPEALANELSAAGFHVIETHTRTGRHPKPRPHGAIVAELAMAD